MPFTQLISFWYYLFYLVVKYEKTDMTSRHRWATVVGGKLWRLVYTVRFNWHLCGKSFDTKYDSKRSSDKHGELFIKFTNIFEKSKTTRKFPQLKTSMVCLHKYLVFISGLYDNNYIKKNKIVKDTKPLFRFTWFSPILRKLQRKKKKITFFTRNHPWSWWSSKIAGRKVVRKKK